MQYIRGLVSMALQHFQRLRARVDALNDAIDEIGTGRSANEDRGILEPQLRDDVGRARAR